MENIILYCDKVWSDLFKSLFTSCFCEYGISHATEVSLMNE